MSNNKLYIGNIPPEINEGSLMELFNEQAGVVPQTIQLKKSFAFIDMSDQETAEKAIEALNGYNIMGSQLLVEPSMPQNRRSQANGIRISNIPEQYPWDDFHRLLSGFGNIQQCDKGTSKTNTTYTAFVTYETQDQTQQAYLQLNNFEIEAGVFLKVEYAMEQVRVRGGRGGGGRGGRPLLYSGVPQSTFRPNDFPLRILVLSDMVGAIIGRGGGTIRQITQQSRARVDVHRKENAGSPEKVITIYGNPENCSTACTKVLEVMQQEATNTNRGEIPLKILAHNSLIGRIIGKNGATIKRIMEQTETKITVSSSIHDVNSFNLERIITVKGKRPNIGKAEQMISAKLRQSYENDLASMAPQAVMFPGVHPMAMMSTIGPTPYPSQRGCPSVPPYGMYGGGGGGGGGGPSYMVYPQNVPQSQDLQKETVIVMIPNGAVGAIIGTGGSTIRDMISSSNASIKVAQPNKDEPVDKQGERRVTVTGTAESQWKAQYMIFKKVSFEGYPGPHEIHLRVEILVPSNQVGRIIGKGGQTVRELQRLTHAVIKFPESQNTENEEAPVHIVGDFYSSQAAQRQIRALIHRNLYFIPRRRNGQSQQAVVPPVQE